jgi:peptidoglycan/xylan/chitin deacetylase (PgdA/CDA1 family)
VKNKVSKGNPVAILVYHRVVPRETRDDLFSLPAIVVYQDHFEEQMKFLSENYHIIPLDEFIEAREKQIPLPLRTVVITFDDGWEDNYHYAFPILRKYHLPATIFLTTGWINTRKIFWPEKVIFLIKNLLSSPDVLKECFVKANIPSLIIRIDRLLRHPERNKCWSKLIDDLKYIDESSREKIIQNLEAYLKDRTFPEAKHSVLNWAQIQEMKRNGVSYGSHGITHRILTLLGEDEVKEELQVSLQSLEKGLGGPIKHFAYPNGDYNGRIIQHLKTLGYRSGLTVKLGYNTIKTDAYRLNRINIHERKILNDKGGFSKELFTFYLEGLL